jgi:hypothetical protein
MSAFSRLKFAVYKVAAAIPLRQELRAVWSLNSTFWWILYLRQCNTIDGPFGYLPTQMCQGSTRQCLAVRWGETDITLSRLSRIKWYREDTEMSCCRGPSLARRVGFWEVRRRWDFEAWVKRLEDWKGYSESVNWQYYTCTISWSPEISGTVGARTKKPRGILG